jgi:hypothetical protein
LAVTYSFHVQKTHVVAPAPYAITNCPRPLPPEPVMLLFVPYPRTDDCELRIVLPEFGYPEHLPTIKAFLAKSHGTSFQSLPDNDIAHQVKNELNKTEGKFKSAWMHTQNLNHYQFRILTFWEHYLDILATRLSIERSQELGFKYELYSGTEWLIRIHSKHYDDEIRERKEKLLEFEKIYFDFVAETRCHHHLKSVNSKLD